MAANVPPQGLVPPPQGQALPPQGQVPPQAYVHIIGDTVVEEGISQSGAYKLERCN